MAQDFFEAFKVGEDNRRISTVDEEGVALATIQGLNQKLEEKAGEIQKLRQQNDLLMNRLNDLEQMVRALAQKK